MPPNLSNVSEKFDKARVLLEESSKNDPESDPYKSKYAAKNILINLKSDLKKMQDLDEYESDTKRLTYLVAAVDYYIGIISLETEELSTGEEHLTTCLDLLHDLELYPQCIIIVLNCYNQLGILWSQRNEPEKSKGYLENAEILYNKYMNECGKPPFDVADVFNEQVQESQLEKNFQKMESILTHTLYYLGQVYSSLEMNDLAAQYYHSTLKRQLESKEFNPVEWAINCGNLSQFFLSRENFKAARHHLSCAADILNQYESELMSKEINDEEDNRWDAFKCGRADLALQWANYGQCLLSTSKDFLLAKADEETTESNAEQNGDSVTCCNPANQSNTDQDDFCVKHTAIFKSLEVTTIEEQVPAEHVLTFPEARQVFLNAQKWLQISKDYYTLDEHASRHVQIIQELSTLYKLLAFFESLGDRQCKMHKRRVDMLENVLKELNPRFYLNICRQLQFELGEIFSDMMEIKSMMLREGETEASAHALQKINHLVKQSISYFTMFLDSFKDSNQKRPDKFTEEMVRPNLLAYFHIGSLYSKLTTNDQDKKLEYLKASKDQFQYIADYCASNEEAVPIMKQELDVATEMIKLFPIKAERILSQIN